MPIAAHFETTQSAGDTLREPRRTLLLEALGATSAGDSASVLIHNVSATGLLLESETTLSAGEKIEIDLPEAGITGANVIWTSGRLAGCEFDSPISAAALSAAQLRSAIEGDLAAASPARTVSRDRTFGARLAALRKARGLTLSQIATELGVSKPTVWAWEQGKARPIESRMEGLTRILGVTRSELSPHAQTPRLEDSGVLGDILEKSRERIAAAVGTTADRVKILIEL